MRRPTFRETQSFHIFYKLLSVGNYKTFWFSKFWPRLSLVYLYRFCFLIKRIWNSAIENVWLNCTVLQLLYIGFKSLFPNSFVYQSYTEAEYSFKTGAGVVISNPMFVRSAFILVCEFLLPLPLPLPSLIHTNLHAHTYLVSILISCPQFTSVFCYKELGIGLLLKFSNLCFWNKMAGEALWCRTSII